MPLPTIPEVEALMHKHRFVLDHGEYPFNVDLDDDGTLRVIWMNENGNDVLRHMVSVERFNDHTNELVLKDTRGDEYSVLFLQPFNPFA